MAAGQPLSRVRLAAASVADDLGYAALAPLGRYSRMGPMERRAVRPPRAPHRTSPPAEAPGRRRTAQQTVSDPALRQSRTRPSARSAVSAVRPDGGIFPTVPNSYFGGSCEVIAAERKGKRFGHELKTGGSQTVLAVRNRSEPSS